jgi:hypothetical protein
MASGLSSYGAIVTGAHRPAVDRILQGEKLASLPVHESIMTESVINPKTTFSLEIQQTVLANRAEGHRLTRAGREMGGKRRERFLVLNFSTEIWSCRHPACQRPCARR